MYSYDIQLLSLFQSQSIVHISNVFSFQILSVPKRVFWGWTNQAQNFFTTFLAITRLDYLTLRSLPLPPNWKTTTRWGLVIGRAEVP